MSLDARVLYDLAGTEATLYLGQVASLNAATAGLRSAAEVVSYNGGTRMRVELRRDGEVIYAAYVRGDGAACS